LNSTVEVTTIQPLTNKEAFRKGADFMKTSHLTISLAAAALMLSASAAFGQNPKAVYFDRQELTIPDFPANGFILDIGGGGEGVIGQLKGNQVISVDPYKEELENAPSTNLKIIMDGRDLKFIDNSFNTAVMFYTLLYINGADHEQVFREVKRVLKHGGRLLIWDVNLPVWKDAAKEFGIFRFVFRLPHKEITADSSDAFEETILIYFPFTATLFPGIQATRLAICCCESGS